MFDPKPILDALENLLDAITPGSPAPPGPTGVDSWDVACQPRGPSQLASLTDRAAIEALARLDPMANSVLNSHGATLDIAMQPFTDVGMSGHTTRSTSPSKSFDVRLNHNRMTPSRFDTALTFIHELAHVKRIVEVGFTPSELVTAINDVRDYVALVWQFEFAAFEAMLAGAQAIQATDPARYRECWQISVANDVVLSALNAGNAAQARREIKSLYAEHQHRQYWNNHHGDPAPPDAAPLWLAYYGFGQSDDPSLWGL